MTRSFNIFAPPRKPQNASFSAPPSSGNWSWRHFCPHTLPERDFYPSLFRVFCTLFDAILICICQCTWPHKIPTFSHCPPIFAPARHQSATQTAPKPAPKLRAFSSRETARLPRRFDVSRDVFSLSGEVFHSREVFSSREAFYSEHAPGTKAHRTHSLRPRSCTGFRVLR